MDPAFSSQVIREEEDLRYPLLASSLVRQPEGTDHRFAHSFAAIVAAMRWTVIGDVEVLWLPDKSY